MRRALTTLLFAAGFAALGCGGKTEVSNREWTDEEKAKIKAQDALVDDEESQGKIKNGKAVKSAKGK